MAGGNYVDVTGATLTLDSTAVGGGDVVTFSLSIESESRDITTWRTYPDSDVVMTKRKVTGSFSYKLQDDEDMLDSNNTARSMVCTLGTDFIFSASVKLTKVDVEHNVDGESEVKVDFVVNGTYTISNNGTPQGS